MRDIFGYLDVEEHRITALFNELATSFKIRLEELTLRDIKHSFAQNREGWQSLVVFECEQDGNPVNFALPFDHFMDNNFAEVQLIP